MPEEDFPPVSTPQWLDIGVAYGNSNVETGNHSNKREENEREMGFMESNNIKKNMF